MFASAFRSLSRNRGDQCFDVTKRESKSLQAVLIALDMRHMIGHHHAVVTNFFVYTHCLEHIDVAVVDECFLEIQETSADIPEVHVKDFAPCAEVSDHVKNLVTRLLQHFRNGTLAKVQTVIRTV